MSDAVTTNVKGLDKLAKALKGKPPVARIGILGAAVRSAKDSAAGPSNAEIGAVHEFGSFARGIPQRSFLREPISDHLQSYMEKSGALDKEVLAEVVRDGSVMPWLKKIAVLGEGIVADGFASGGFGKWPPHAAGYENNTGMLLVDTTQLRGSITSEVK